MSVKEKLIEKNQNETLPMHPYLTEAEQQTVIGAVLEAL